MSIAVKLVGGLGNQMWQYALGRRLADERSEKLFLDGSYYQTVKNLRFSLDVFNIRFDIPDQEDFNTQLKVIQEKSMAYDPSIFEIEGDLILTGYWQNPKYLPSIESLRSDFSLRQDINTNLFSLRQLIKDNNAVSVHVRGGDYKGWRKFDVVTPEYYNKAFEKIVQEIEKPLFFVFTNDREYAEWILYDVQKKYQIILVGGEDWEELSLMQICKYHIIVNSTLSWWGSHLSCYSNKKIIAPSIWFHPDGQTNEHIEISPWTEKMMLVKP